jgi:thiol:disulfide interchange protein
MNAIWATSLALGALFFFAPGSFAAEEITWSHDLTASLAQAKKENKLVFVDFYTEWCGPCKALDRDTFHDAKFVQVMSKDFIAVKLDAEHDGLTAAQQQDVSAYPTGLVFSANGKVVKRFVGFMSAPKYAAALKKLGKSK